MAAQLPNTMYYARVGHLRRGNLHAWCAQANVCAMLAPNARSLGNWLPPAMIRVYL
jgi:hypothetical protein